MKNLCFAKKDFINSKVFLEEKKLEKNIKKKKNIGRSVFPTQEST